MAAKLLVMIAVVAVIAAAGGVSAAAANTPNSWFSCMADCPKYHCQALGYLPIGGDAACQAYCGTLCAIPPKAKDKAEAEDKANTLAVAAAANTVNSWFSCMADCPKYHCQALGYLPIGGDAACQAYCGTLCAIPPKAKDKAEAEAKSNTLAVAAAANTPNSWFSCMADCPKYHCQALGYLPIGGDAACQAYCGTLCAIPPKAKAKDKVEGKANTLAVAAAANTPNSWFSCMADCPKYHCQALGYLPIGGDAACQAYCGTLCAIPPKADTFTIDAHNSADLFCKLGCVSSKCATLKFSMLGGAEADQGCIHSCNDICSSFSTKLVGSSVV